jgi:hypothetical protein
MEWTGHITYIFVKISQWEETTYCKEYTSVIESLLSIVHTVAYHCYLQLYDHLFLAELIY